MTVKLHDSVLGEGPDVVLLHGLFGMGSNLGSLARALQGRYRVHSVDLPNHGHSGWLDEASLVAQAQCVAQWMDERHLHSATFVGHSLGGKVAMQLALQQPLKVDALVVADIAPVNYEGSHDDVFAALDAVAARSVRSRAEAAAIMAPFIEEDMVTQFLLLSLQRDTDGSYHWRFNLQGLKDNYAAVREAPELDIPYDGPTLFISGGDSPYIAPEYHAAIETCFPSSSISVMPGCGHWLHAQDPNTFNALVGDFLDSI
ncbi:MAG: alpha/beta fold hydrolase [Halioglobus sp.]